MVHVCRSEVNSQEAGSFHHPGTFGEQTGVIGLGSKEPLPPEPPAQRTKNSFAHHCLVLIITGLTTVHKFVNKNIIYCHAFHFSGTGKEVLCSKGDTWGLEVYNALWWLASKGKTRKKQLLCILHLGRGELWKSEIG